MTEMKRIARKSDVWQTFVQKGMLIRLHVDTEGTALERDFSQITAYGDASGDIAGNYIDSMELFVKKPDRYLPSLQASLVTRTSPEDNDDPSRLVHREAMGRIVNRIDGAPGLIMNLGLPEKDVSFSTIRKIGEDIYEKEFTETVLQYPLLDDQGKTVYDVRYHPERRMVAYRFDDNPASPYYENIENGYYVDEDDGSKWKLVDERVAVRGYRLKWADLYWVRANMVRAGYHPSNTFFTHARATVTSKQSVKNYAFDDYSVALAVNLFGPQGEDGLKMGTRRDPRTGDIVSTAKLEKIMEANTRYESTARGVRRGITMAHDGTLYDANFGHNSPKYDAIADFSAYNYCQEIAPDIVKRVDSQSDEQELRRYLSGTDPTKPQMPIFVVPRNAFPYPATSDPVAFLGFDDQLGKLRRVIMPRLDVNLRSYTYNGKKLAQMSPEDLALMMQKQGRGPDCVVRIESVRRWPGAMNLFGEALSEAGRHGWDIEQIIDSFRFLKENPRLCENIRVAVEAANWELQSRPPSPNEMMEEQAVRNGFGDLDYIETDAAFERSRAERMGASRGTVSNFSEMLFNKATDIFKYHNSIDEILHRLALQPHPVDYSDSPEDLQNFKDLVLRARQHFRRKKCPYMDVFKPFFDSNGAFCVKSAERARELRWELMKRFLDDDQKERVKKESRYGEGIFDYRYTKSGRILFANLSRDFRVVDHRGRHLDMDYLKRQYGMHPMVVQKKFERGDWRIQFYRLSSEPSITATLFQFADCGKLGELTPLWQARYAVLRNLYLHGAPNEDPSQGRWQSLPVVERALHSIEVNMQTGSDEGLARNFSPLSKGEAEVYVKTDEGQRIVAEYRAYIEKIKREFTFSNLQKQFMHYDPDTSVAYDRIDDEIPAENIVVVNVPDTHLRKPLEDIRMPPYSLIVGKLPEEQKKKIEKGAPVIFRGEMTGRMYYGGPVSLRRLPENGKGYSDYLEKARRSYEEGNYLLPPTGEQDILLIQKLQPVANSRPEGLDARMQSIKVPSLYFDGLTSPRLAHFPTRRVMTGMVIPVNFIMQKLEEGKPIRFREMSTEMNAKLTGDNAKDTGHTIESKCLRSVQRMTLGELHRQVLAGEISDVKAQSCGFASAFDLWEKVNDAMLSHESPNPSREEIYLLEFERVDRRTWAYFNPPELPKAAFSYGGLPVSPSAYRWGANGANDNQAMAPASRRGRATKQLRLG